MVKFIKLVTGELLISSIDEVPSELGEPDCKLSKPYQIIKHKIEALSDTIEPWLSSYSSDEDFMISSDKILTIFEPKEYFLEKYESLTK